MFWVLLGFVLGMISLVSLLVWVVFVCLFWVCFGYLVAFCVVAVWVGCFGFGFGGCGGFGFVLGLLFSRLGFVVGWCWGFGGCCILVLICCDLGGGF